MVLEAWCPITTAIVASQFPSSSGTVLVTCFPLHLTSACLNTVKQLYHNKHIYNESANVIDSGDVVFDTNDWWYHPKPVPVITIESTVTCARIRYTRDYVPLGICSLIRPFTTANSISVPAEIITVVLYNTIWILTGWWNRFFVVDQTYENKAVIGIVLCEI